MGSRLRARGTLDELAQTVAPRGEPFKSFEALVEALDAAAQRAECRLPIVIDSLGEAEQPKDWADALAGATAMLRHFPHVLLIVTLRTEFVPTCLPADVRPLELDGFTGLTGTAVQKYFAHYNIDAEIGGESGVPNEFLEHPLMLRMFCEVTNPTRKHPVSAAGLPGSLTALFDRLLDQVAIRVSDQTPSSAKLYQREVRDALSGIGRVLWDSGRRFVDFKVVREAIGDAGREWHVSVIRLLESEGLLIRNARPDEDNLAGFAYDLFAGHVIAEALLLDHGQRLASWLQSNEALEKLFGPQESAHPLRRDIFRALVGLSPRRLQGTQLWKVVPPAHAESALLASMELEVAQLDEETVSAVRALLINDRPDARRVFYALRRTRALPRHPLNADFLDGVLRAMPNDHRDTYWTEWVRANEDDIRSDLESAAERLSRATEVKAADLLRARWTTWVLTTTIRPLRDHATRALTVLGRASFAQLRQLATGALSVSDPYVPERVLCASYGAALDSLGDLHEDARLEIVALARELFSKMFKPGAPHSSKHVLMREYALGIISLARMLQCDVVATSDEQYLQAPFSHLPSPFATTNQVSDAVVAAADSAAIRMDFGNYTMGRLVADRQNYDYNHAEYVAMRRDIVARMTLLGYSPAVFTAIDNTVAGASWRRGRGDHATVDRYGKKYGWIALFEMHGVRADQGRLPDYRDGDRCVEADLDPCFPGEHRQWNPPLKPLFTKPMGAPAKWLAGGVAPDYEHFMHLNEVDGLYGPWILIDGYLSEVAEGDPREVFTFVQSLFVARSELGALMSEFNSTPYPGNSQIPFGSERHYTFLGEMPFARNELPLGLGQPTGIAEDIAHAFTRFEKGRWLEGLSVLPATQKYAWESYHSSLNTGGGAKLPNVPVCTALRLRYQPGTFDLVDEAGVASLYRVVSQRRGGEEVAHGHLAYLRADLLQRYLAETGFEIATFTWGERSFHYRSNLSNAPGLHEVYASHGHIHKHTRVWRAT